MSALFILETAEDIFSQTMERSDMFWDLVENSVKSKVRIQRADVSKILNGSRDVPKKMAAQILDEKNIDKIHFQDYIERQISKDDEIFKRDSLVENLPDNPYGVNTDSLNNDNVASYFTEVWFKYLQNCKNKVQHRSSKKPVLIDPQDIGERIRKVVLAFKDINEADTKFTDAKKVKEKIDKTQEFHLFKKIETNVNDYFLDIKRLFVEEQETSDLIYEQVRRKMRNKYLAEKEKTAHETFNRLVDWLMLEVGTTDREACEAVMSYFVQSCEVFGK